MNQPPVTIIVPMRNEEANITRCLASLLEQDYPVELVEILVMDGESTDRSPEIVQELATQHPRIRLLPNPGRSQSAAMNAGLRAAQGEIIVRADAHATYGPSYLPICVRHLVAGEAENVGGLQCGVGDALFSRAVAAAQNSALGSGGAAYRLATEPCYVDTVWLGAWWKRTLEEVGGFNEALRANEDYELNLRIREHGGRILLDPALPSTYTPRATPGSLWRQYFRYGQAKVAVWRLHPKSLLPRQVIPPVFVLALLIATALVSLTPYLVAVLAVLYLLAVLAAALRTPALFLPLLIVYPTIHLAWGLGFWWGMLRRKFGRNITR